MDKLSNPYRVNSIVDDLRGLTFGDLSFIASVNGMDREELGLWLRSVDEVSSALRNAYDQHVKLESAEKETA